MKIHFPHERAAQGAQPLWVFLFNRTASSKKTALAEQRRQAGQNLQTWAKPEHESNSLKMP